jgi:hypothetical protein
MLGDERFLPEPRNTRGWPRNRRQLEWALHVVRDGMTYTDAAKLVYDTVHSSQVGSELAKRIAPFISFLQERKNAIAEREFGVTTERVLREVSAVALADKISFVRPVLIKGVARYIGKDPSQLTNVQRIAVHSWTETVIETDSGSEIDYRYRLHGKQPALDFLGKHLGMLSEKLLVEMMARRSAANSADYTNVSTDDLNAAIDTLKQLREQLKNSKAIDLKAERVVHSPFIGGSRGREEESNDAQRLLSAGD